MPLQQVNLVSVMSWFLQRQTPFSPDKQGPTSESATLAGLNLATWSQLFMEDITIFANFTITGDTHTSTTVDNVSPTDIAKLVVGQTLTGTGFASGTKIATISTTSFTTNIATTATNAGVTIRVQTAVTGLAATPSSTGGTLTAATYYYVVTADGNQPGTSAETIRSNEASAVIATSTGSVALTWTSVTGASAYNIYRGTVAGSENVLVGRVVSTNGTSAPLTTFTDDGSFSTSQSPPSVQPNSYCEFDLSSFTNQVSETVTPSKILAIAVYPQLSTSGSSATCIFGPGQTSGLVWFFDSVTDTITIPLGGQFSFSGSISYAGQTIDGTHKTLRITNSGYEALNVVVGAIVNDTLE